MKQSIRTCLVTGKQCPKQQLLRFVIQEGIIVFDKKSCLPGRGGYVLNTSEAIATLKKNPKLHKKVAHFMKVGKVEVG